MNETLLSGTVINDRYVVKKIIHETEHTNLYMGIDLATNGKVTINEIFIPREFKGEKLNNTRQLIYNTIEELKLIESPYLQKLYDYFCHSNIDYIVAEYVEGIAIDKLCAMSVSGLNIKDILPWIYQILDALNACFDRPTPYVFSQLELPYIYVDVTKNIKLIGYGLDQFYFSDRYDTAEFDSKNFSLVVQKIAKIIYFMLTRTSLTKTADFRGLHVNPDFKKILELCFLQPDNSTYTNFSDLKNDIIKSFEEPVIPVKKEPQMIQPKKPAVKIKSPAELVKTGVKLFLSQKLLYLGIELAVVFLIFLFFLISSIHVNNFNKKGPVFFVFTDDRQIIAIDKTKNKIQGKFYLESFFSYGISNKDGSLLFLCNKNLPEIFVVETKKFKILTRLKMDSTPSKILLSLDESQLFVTINNSNNLIVVSVPTDFTQENLEIQSVVQLQGEPIDICFNNMYSLLFTCEDVSDAVSIIKPSKGIILKTIFSESEGLNSITISQTKREIYVSVKEMYQIFKYDYSFNQNSSTKHNKYENEDIMLVQNTSSQNIQNSASVQPASDTPQIQTTQIQQDNNQNLSDQPQITPQPSDSITSSPSIAPDNALTNTPSPTPYVSPSTNDRQIIKKSDKISYNLDRKYLAKHPMTQILLDINENNLFILYPGEKSVGILKLTDTQVKDEVTVGDKPISMIQTKSNELWVLSKDGKLYLVDPTTKIAMKILDLETNVNSFSFSP